MSSKNRIFLAVLLLFVWLGIGSVVSALAVRYTQFDFSLLWVAVPGLALCLAVLWNRSLGKVYWTSLCVSALAGALFTYSTSAVRHALEQDKCLDSGGRWSAETKLCEH